MDSFFGHTYLFNSMKTPLGTALVVMSTAKVEVCNGGLHENCYLIGVLNLWSGVGVLRKENFLATA